MEQEHKQFYCPVDKMKTIFVEHATKKGLWICTQCRYTTSNPKQDPKMPETTKRKSMDDFWDNMAKKSNAFQHLNQEKSY